MKMNAMLGVLALGLIASAQAHGGDTGQCEPPQQGCLQRLNPVGGWNPYGGGLFHWWNRHCFPRCGGPDDYCRKPLPRVCWPAYPAYYIQAPPEGSCPYGGGRADCARTQ